MSVYNAAYADPENGRAPRRNAWQRSPKALRFPALPAVYALIFLFIATHGAGKWSVDAARGTS